MRRKKRDPERAAAEIEHQLMMAAGKIGERFPSLKSLRIKQIYTDFDGVASPSEQVASLGLESSAYLRYKCPYWECVQGGFDLSGPVADLVRSRKAETSGTLTCSGWQDCERIGKHHCYCKLSYTLSAEYRDV